MANIQGDFLQVRNKMDNTFKDMSEFTKGWKDLSNCGIVSRSFMLFNGGVCQAFRNSTVYFYIFLAFGNFSIKINFRNYLFEYH